MATLIDIKDDSELDEFFPTFRQQEIYQLSKMLGVDIENATNMYGWNDIDNNLTLCGVSLQTSKIAESIKKLKEEQNNFKKSCITWQAETKEIEKRCKNIFIELFQPAKENSKELAPEINNFNFKNQDAEATIKITQSISEEDYLYRQDKLKDRPLIANNPVKITTYNDNQTETKTEEKKETNANSNTGIIIS